jgi:hypothetical protein
MKREDIVCIAREAGVSCSWDLNWNDPVFERFANLIEKKIREEDREQAIVFLRTLHDSFSLESDASGLKDRL